MLNTWNTRRSPLIAWIKDLVCCKFTTIAFFLVPSLQAQEPPRLGDIFVVNGYTTDYQRGSAVAVNDDGSFMVVWNSSGFGSYDSNIQARRFDSKSMPLGGDFRVDANTTGRHFQPHVAAAPNGDLVVVWSQSSDADGSGVERSIQARQFLSNGSPIGGQFQINSPTLNDNFRPRVAVSSEGDFIVVWTTESSVGDDSDEWSVQGRRFSSAGTSLGDQFQINTLTTDRQRDPSLAINPDGNFLVAWQSNFVGEGQFGSEVRVQQFRPDGSRLGQEFPVSSDDLGYKGNTDIAVNPEGDFTVIWSDSPDVLPECHSLESRRVFSNGSFAGAPRELVELSNTCKYSPKIKHESNGGFVIVWSNDDSSDSDPFGRRFNADGEPLTDPFPIGPTNAYQSRIDIGMDEDDNFVVVWDGSPFVPNDEEPIGIYAQRFCGLDCLLFDGFESGDTSAWSTTMGQ